MSEHDRGAVQRLLSQARGETSDDDSGEFTAPAATSGEPSVAAAGEPSTDIEAPD